MPQHETDHHPSVVRLVELPVQFSPATRRDLGDQMTGTSRMYTLKLAMGFSIVPFSCASVQVCRQSHAVACLRYRITFTPLKNTSLLSFNLHDPDSIWVS